MERRHVCALRHVSSREDARGKVEAWPPRRGRGKKLGKLVTLLTDGRLLKCPLKVLLLGARPDEVWLGASSRRRRPHLGRHGDADFCSLFLPFRGGSLNARRKPDPRRKVSQKSRKYALILKTAISINPACENTLTTLLRVFNSRDFKLRDLNEPWWIWKKLQSFCTGGFWIICVLIKCKIKKVIVCKV